MLKFSNTIGNPQYNNYAQFTVSEKNYNENSNNLDEEHVLNPCVICLQNRNSTYVFLPCGHAQVCGNCEALVALL